LALLDGKWKVAIFWQLTLGPKRFGELQRLVPGITHKMLTQHLRELERDKVVVRSVGPETPPSVTYALSPLGASLQRLLRDVDRWGRKHLEPPAELS